MDPILEEKQNEIPQQKRSSQGSISQGINTINNLQQARRSLPNFFGKVGQRVVTQTALRGFAAFLAGTGLPIAIALVAVFILTLIIVMGFGGAPSSGPDGQTTNVTPTTIITPTIAPTETPTLPPVVP